MNPLLPPDPAAMLAELVAEGNVPVPEFLRKEHPSDFREGPTSPRPDHPRSQAGTSDEVGERYAENRRRIIAKAGERTWTSYTDGLKRVRYSHEDCIDRILMSPGITQLELSQLYGVTPTWMSIVCNSDAFKVRLAERKEELVDPALMTSLNERYGALAARSVEILLDKLNQPMDKITDKLALEAAALGAKAVGLGEAKPSAPGNAADHLAAIAHRLMDLNVRPPGQVVDAQARQIEGG